MSLPAPEILQLQIGKALRRLRKRRGLTSVEVARRLGMKRSSSGQICRWERGACSPRFDAVWRYVDAVGASLSELVGELVPTKASPRLMEIADELEKLAGEAPRRSRPGRLRARR
ncbi:MAG: helix-turn-helix domain-containing protein [bacterium]|nr:helix-turn-helix domain-containing protein [bacterium]